MAGEQYIVITNPEDEQIGHVPFVAAHMDGKLMTVNPVPAIIAGRGLSFAIGKAGTQCIYNDHPLDRVAAVWDRRPSPQTQDMFEVVEPAYRRYAFSAVQKHAQQLYMQFSDALWVSDRLAVQRAEHKALQLEVANRLNFKVPETIMTSDPVRAQQFVASRPATIVKSLGIEGVTIDDTMLLFFSHRVTPKTELDYSQLRFGPAIFQQAIEPAYDLRITVVDEEVFAAAIVADVEEKLVIGVRDWRIGNHNGNLSITACELPPDIQAKCRALVKTLNLKFGAIDMIVDRKGNFWFIEINPSGQWAFVEDVTKQPIGRALARLLLSATPG
jgi:glutathione synthase/RimK-type ligase-like ATP-grasp enzyme